MLDIFGTSQPHFLDDLVVFDIETTGLSATYNEIIQIAAVRIVNGEMVPDSIFSTYVKNSRPIPLHITCLSGIDDTKTRSAPGLEGALRDFARYCGSSMTCAHNGRLFDSRFIGAACKNLGLVTRSNGLIDSLDLSRIYWGSTRDGHTLDAVCRRLDIDISRYRRHDAADDVRILASVLTSLPRDIYFRAKTSALMLPID